VKRNFSLRGRVICDSLSRLTFGLRKPRSVLRVKHRAGEQNLAADFYRRRKIAICHARINPASRPGPGRTAVAFANVDDFEICGQVIMIGHCKSPSYGRAPSFGRDAVKERSRVDGRLDLPTRGFRASETNRLLCLPAQEWPQDSLPGSNNGA
jgi:hypothetical protein